MGKFGKARRKVSTEPLPKAKIKSKRDFSEETSEFRVKYHNLMEVIKDLFVFMTEKEAKVLAILVLRAYNIQAPLGGFPRGPQMNSDSVMWHKRRSADPPAVPCGPYWERFKSKKEQEEWCANPHRHVHGGEAWYNKRPEQQGDCRVIRMEDDPMNVTYSLGMTALTADQKWTTEWNGSWDNMIRLLEESA